MTPQDELDIYLDEQVGRHLGILGSQVNLHMVHCANQASNPTKGVLGGRPWRIYYTRTQMTQIRRENDAFLLQFKK